jgi:hypothetical protein
MSFNGIVHNPSHLYGCRGAGNHTPHPRIAFHFNGISATTASGINAVEERLFRGSRDEVLPSMFLKGSVSVSTEFQCFRMSQWVVILYVHEQS